MADKAESSRGLFLCPPVGTCEPIKLRDAGMRNKTFPCGDKLGQSCFHPLVPGLMHVSCWGQSTVCWSLFSTYTVSSRMHPIHGGFFIQIGLSAVPSPNNSVFLLGQHLLGDVICERPVGPKVMCLLPHLLCCQVGLLMLRGMQCYVSCENADQTLGSPQMAVLAEAL